MHAPKRDNPGRDVVQRSVMDAEIRSTDTLSVRPWCSMCLFIANGAGLFFNVDSLLESFGVVLIFKYGSERSIHEVTFRL